MSIRVPKDGDVRVYGWWQEPKFDPFDRIPLSEASELYDKGWAILCNNSKALQLVNAPEVNMWIKHRVIRKWSIRGLSCQMPGWLTEACSEGKHFAVAILQSYRSAETPA